MFGNPNRKSNATMSHKWLKRKTTHFQPNVHVWECKECGMSLSSVEPPPSNYVWRKVVDGRLIHLNCLDYLAWTIHAV